MTTTEQIEIPLSKGKLIVLFLASILFVALGLSFVITQPTIEYGVFRNLYRIGIALILFFGFGAFVLLKKMKDNKPGLIVNKIGITDNTSGVSVGFIPWNEIIEIKKTKINYQKCIVIMVSNPHKYLNETNILKRKKAEINFNNLGSPLCILANLLKYNYDELFNVLQTEFNESKK